jgi:hypothetical protein
MQNKDNEEFQQANFKEPAVGVVSTTICPQQLQVPKPGTYKMIVPDRKVGQLVLVLGGVVLGRDDESSSLAGAAVDGLHDIDHLLLVSDRPVDLVVIAGRQVHHDVAVAEEEHDGALVIELVHGVEVGNLRDIHEIRHGEVLHIVGHFKQGFIHLHAGGVPIVTKPDNNDLIFFC